MNATRSAPKPRPPTTPRATKPPVVTLDGALRLHESGSALGGADRVALLEAIRDTGSMTRAAKAVGISYKTAWDRVQAMSNVSREPLVERSAGGAGGGGTVLTPHALALVAAFRELERTHAKVLGRLPASLARPRDLLGALATLGLRTSARNQLVGTVAKVARGPVNAAIELALPGSGDRIHATLTLQSLRDLGLKRGVPAVALIKAPSVFLAAEAAGTAAPERLSVRNALTARITGIDEGAGDTEVRAQLAGGQTMVALVGRDSVRRLALAVGAPVRLLFQESSVIVGVV